MIICQQTGKCVDCGAVGKGYLVEKATPSENGFAQGVLCQRCAVEYLELEVESLNEKQN